MMYTVSEVMSMYSILVCDDDKEIVEAIEIYLSQEGYRILKAYDGVEAIKILESEEVNLLILDVMMPRLDGIRATLKIREKNSIPIIILSAKSEDADKILGLNVGADDYVTKPFSPLELVARVKSQLRRYTQLGGTASREQDTVYEVGGLRMNDDLKEVTVDGELSLFGTVNMDMRSMHLNYELMLLVFDEEFSRKVSALNSTYAAFCSEINLFYWYKRSIFERMKEGASYLLSPLL